MEGGVGGELGCSTIHLVQGEGVLKDVDLRPNFGGEELQRLEGVEFPGDVLPFAFRALALRLRRPRNNRDGRRVAAHAYGKYRGKFSATSSKPDERVRQRPESLLHFTLNPNLVVMGSESHPLHFLFFPFMAPSHMNSLKNIVKLFTGHNIKTTLLITTANQILVQPVIDRANQRDDHHPMDIILIFLPSTEVGLPERYENYDSRPSNLLDPSNTFIKAVNMYGKSKVGQRTKSRLRSTA